MQIEHQEKEGIHIFQLEGNLTLNGVKIAKQTIRPIVDDESTQSVVLDFTKVKLIDSSGIGFLVSSFNRLKGRKAKMVLFGLNDVILDIFKSTRLDSIFTIVASEEEAINSF